MGVKKRGSGEWRDKKKRFNTEHTENAEGTERRKSRKEGFNTEGAEKTPRPGRGKRVASGETRKKRLNAEHTVNAEFTERRKSRKEGFNTEGAENAEGTERKRGRRDKREKRRAGLKPSCNLCSGTSHPAPTKTGKKEEGHVVLCPSGIEEDGPCKTLLVRTGSGGSRGGVADGVAVDHELDAAVALAAFGGLVGGDGLDFAEAAGGDGRRRYALFGEKFAHGTGAALGKLLIEFVAADAVGVAFDLKHEAGMRENDAGNFRELFARAGLERVAAGVEKNIRHIDDEAAGGD